MQLVRSLMVGVIAVAMAWSALPLHTTSAQDDSPVSPDMLAEFEAIIESEMAFFHIPGAAVAVIQDGEMVYAQGFGVRSVESGEPFTPQTQFRIGSTGKSMTSLMIAQLVDEGVLSWDTPVVEIVPDFQTTDPDLTAKLTVSDLMNMGTGLEPNGMFSLEWGAWSVDDIFAAIASMSIAGEYRQLYAYNNEVYAAAAYVAAITAGEPATLHGYKQMMQARVFDPVDMPTTIITDDLDELGDNVADSYSFTLLGDITAPDPVRDAPINVIAPAGGMWSTLDDMARYMITQMNGGVTPDGVRVVSEAALAATWKPQVDIPAELPRLENVSYGMGWITGTYDGTPLRFHDGGWAGYRTQIAIFPDTQTGLIIFANHSLGNSFNYGLMVAFAEILNGRDPSPMLDELNTGFETNFGNLDAQLTQLPPPEVERTDVEPLLGHYEQDWSIELRDDDLLWLVRSGWAFALRPLPGDNAYLIASGTIAGATVQFILDGDPVAFRVEIGGDTVTFAKTE